MSDMTVDEAIAQVARYCQLRVRVTADMLEEARENEDWAAYIVLLDVLHKEAAWAVDASTMWGARMIKDLVELEDAANRLRDDGPARARVLGASPEDIFDAVDVLNVWWQENAKEIHANIHAQQRREIMRLMMEGRSN